MKLTNNQKGAAAVIAGAVVVVGGAYLANGGNSQSEESDGWGGSGGSGGISGTGNYQTFAEQLAETIKNGAGDLFQPPTQQQETWNEPGANEPSILDTPTLITPFSMPETPASDGGKWNFREWFTDTFNPYAKEGQVTLGDVAKNPLLAFSPSSYTMGTGSGGARAATGAEAKNTKTAPKNSGTGTKKSGGFGTENIRIINPIVKEKENKPGSGLGLGSIGGGFGGGRGGAR